MQNQEWFEQIKFCLAPHPMLHPEAGEIYTPKDGYEVAFLFQGLPAISGKFNELEVNFNSDAFLILSKNNFVTRIIWSAFSGIQLSQIPKEQVKKAKLYVLPKSKT